MARTDGGFRSVLVGRAQELADLGDFFDSALNGDPQVVILAGEAGIGKSRLLAEFVRRTGDQARAVVGHCLELGPDGPPFAPFAMILRSLVAELGRQRVTELAGPAAPDLALLVPDLGVETGPDALGRGRLFEATATLIEHLAEERPLVVAMEDLHWSDSSTRDLIAFLTRTVSVSRVLFVLTYRKDELPRTHPLLAWLGEIDRLPAAHRITLERLADDEVDELVRTLAGPVPPRTGARIRERSEGIPFFVEELTSCCGVDPDVTVIPDSLRDLMLTRLDRLSDPTRAIVKMASASNTQVDHAVLQAMAGLADSAFDRALREAVSGQVLVVDDSQEGYAFRHALMREAVHADLLPGEHARLHARYAAALEAEARPGQAGEIAHHWILAHEARKSFDWSLRAADEARSVYAWQEELNHLNRALDLWDQVPVAGERAGFGRVELMARAGRAAGDTGRSDQAIAFYDAALADVDERGDPQLAAHLLVLRARQCAVPREGALPDLTRALELAAPGSADRAAALCHTASHQMLTGRLQEAVGLALQAIEAAELADAPDLAGHAHNTLGCSLFQTGRVEEGFEHLERSRQLAVASGDWPGLLRYHGNKSDALIGHGRFDEAVRVAHEGRAAAAERGWNRTMGAFLGGNEAEALVHAGRWDEALVTIDDVLRLDPAAITLAHLFLMRAMVRLRRGDLAGCADDVDSATEHLGYGITQPQYLLPVSALRAGLEAAAGDPLAALRRLEQAADVERMALTTATGWPFAFTYAQIVGQALAVDPQPDPGGPVARAARAARDVTHHLASVSDPLGWSALLAAQLRDNESALEQGSAPGGADSTAHAWRAAVTVLAATPGLRYELAYARIRWAAHLLADGRRDDAREQLTSAWRAIDELGAETLRPEAARVAASARIPLRASRRGTALLTDREREVLDLVATGKSNRAISEELYISIKTTSVHVSHILAKIGASSRTEAAAWAHENGIGPGAVPVG